MYETMFSKVLFIFLVGAAIPAYIEATTCLPQLNGPGTKSPINIISSKTTLANVTTPVILFNGVLNFLTLRNEGKAIEAFPNEAVDTTFVTGGVLCKQIFKLHKLRFFVNNQNPQGRSGETVNGRGTPLEAVIIYYNIKYDSFQEALKHKGAVTIISFRIAVGPVPNLLFIPLQVLLSLGVIRQPGSSFILPSPLVYIWFDVIQFIYQYFAYSGSYYDPNTNKQTLGANIIETIPIIAEISYSQFAAFKNVLGYDGNPIQAVGPIYPQKSTTVYRGFGFAQGLQFF